MLNKEFNDFLIVIATNSFTRIEISMEIFQYILSQIHYDRTYIFILEETLTKRLTDFCGEDIVK